MEKNSEGRVSSIAKNVNGRVEKNKQYVVRIDGQEISSGTLSTLPNKIKCMRENSPTYAAPHSAGVTDDTFTFVSYVFDPDQDKIIVAGRKYKKDYKVLEGLIGYFKREYGARFPSFRELKEKYKPKGHTVTDQLLDRFDKDLAKLREERLHNLNLKETSVDGEQSDTSNFASEITTTTQDSDSGSRPESHFDRRDSQMSGGYQDRNEFDEQEPRLGADVSYENSAFEVNDMKQLCSGDDEAYPWQTQKRAQRHEGIHRRGCHSAWSDRSQNCHGHGHGQLPHGFPGNASEVVGSHGQDLAAAINGYDCFPSSRKEGRASGMQQIGYENLGTRSLPIESDRGSYVFSSSHLIGIERRREQGEDQGHENRQEYGSPLDAFDEFQDDGEDRVPSTELGACWDGFSGRVDREDDDDNNNVMEYNNDSSMPTGIQVDMMKRMGLFLSRNNQVVCQDPLFPHEEIQASQVRLDLSETIVNHNSMEYSNWRDAPIENSTKDSFWADLNPVEEEEEERERAPGSMVDAWEYEPIFDVDQEIESDWRCRYEEQLS